jgi:hypothetical protein
VSVCFDDARHHRCTRYAQRHAAAAAAGDGGGGSPTTFETETEGPADRLARPIVRTQSESPRGSSTLRGRAIKKWRGSGSRSQRQIRTEPVSCPRDHHQALPRPLIIRCAPAPPVAGALGEMATVCTPRAKKRPPCAPPAGDLRQQPLPGGAQAWHPASPHQVPHLLEAVLWRLRALAQPRRAWHRHVLLATSVSHVKRLS